MRLYNILKNKSNLCCIKQWYRKIVCVRFAPSPTGKIHFGGLRMALINYLFAKKNNGKFILRLEDTDQSRIVPGSSENLEKILTLSGIIPDEGPSQGGPNGPYIQSQRLSIYENKVKDLINNGSAYKCFCTESRLDILRKEASKRRETPRYDNKCRHLSKSELEELIAQNKPYCIRFKIDDGPLTFNDLVYGDITLSLVEGDPVIFKSDGFPTYHFACVVDDYLMEVTHVLRGVEWQVSTPKHILLYKAFGWKPPQFAHLPLLLNRDGTKLSKRHGDIDIESILSRGYYPEAIVNLVASIGGGFGQIYDQLPTLSIPEMVEKFNFSKLNVNSCQLNFDKLQYFNQNCLVNEISDANKKHRLVETFEALLYKQFGSDNINIEPKALENSLQCCITMKRISTLNDLLEPRLVFLWKKPTLLSESFQEHDGELLQRVAEQLDELPEGDFQSEKLMPALKDICRRQPNYQYKYIMHLLRIVLSGQKTGPSVPEMLEMLGKMEALDRLRCNVRTAAENIKSTVTE